MSARYSIRLSLPSDPRETLDASIKNSIDSSFQDRKISSCQYNVYKTSVFKNLVNAVNDQEKLTQKKAKTKSIRLRSITTSYNKRSSSPKSKETPISSNQSPTESTPKILLSKIKALEETISSLKLELLKKEEKISDLEEKAKKSSTESSNKNVYPLGRALTIKDQFASLFKNENDESEEISRDIQEDLKSQKLETKKYKDLYESIQFKLEFTSKRNKELEEMVDKYFSDKETKENKESPFSELLKKNKNLYDELIRVSDKLYDTNLIVKDLQCQNSKIFAEFSSLKEKNLEIPHLRQHVLQLITILKNLKQHLKAIPGHQNAEKNSENIMKNISDLESLTTKGKNILKSFIQIVSHPSSKFPKASNN